MVGIFADLSGKTVVSPEYRTERIFDIRSSIHILLKLCFRCFGNSSSSKVSNLMMVNNIHQGLALHQTLCLFDIESFIHEHRVAPGEVEEGHVKQKEYFQKNQVYLWQHVSMTSRPNFWVLIVQHS